MATGDLHKNFVKIGPAVPEIWSRTDRHRQANRQKKKTHEHRDRQKN